MEEGLNYVCPDTSCRREFPGPIGRTNLKNHVQKYHPELFKAFSERSIEDFKMTTKISKDDKRGNKPKTSESDTVDIPEGTKIEDKEPPKEEDKEPPKEEDKTPPADETKKDTVPPLGQMPTYQEKPTWQVEEPEDWLGKFLRAYKFREMFVRIQVEQVRQTKELPYAGSLFQDMQSMDSGVTNRPTISWIVQQYERQVKQYMKKYEELMNTMTRRGGGYPMQDGEYGFRDTYPSCDMPTTRKGMYVGREQQQPQQRQQPSYYENDRVARLEDQIRQRDDEARRKMEFEYNNMKMKIEQGLTRQEDPQLLALKQQLDQQASETKALTAQLAAQKETVLLDRLVRVEQNVPSADQINMFIDGKLKAHDTSDLDRKIKEAVDASKGVTKLDIDLKKVDKDYDIEQRKLEVEEKKGNMWGETIKDVAGLFGEGLGKGMSTGNQPPVGTQTQPGQQQTQQTSCPHCGTPLMLPPNVKFGVCPKCNGKMEIGIDGIPMPFKQTEPKPDFIQQQEPPDLSPQGPLESDAEPGYKGTFERPNPTQKKAAEGLGICPVCGKPVYDDNIGKTEGGDPYHKECC